MSTHYYTPSNTPGLTDDQIDALATKMLKDVADGDDERVQALWDVDYEDRPVPVRQFLEDDYYLGSCLARLSETWKRELEIVFSPDTPIVQWVMTGAIGIGKTTVAAVAIAYKLYLLACLRNPIGFFPGLMQGSSKIVFGFYNVTLKKADDGYTILKGYLDASPWFKEHSPRRMRPENPVLLPRKNLLIDTGSLETHALGANLLGCVIDEANFFKKGSGSDGEEKNRAQNLYNQVWLRLVSRFLSHGRMPGLIMLLSSRQTQTSFLESILDQAATNEEVGKFTHISDFSLWDARPEKGWSPRRFQVMVGDDKVPSRVLEPEELPPQGHRIVSVPVDLYRVFCADVDLALRDVAGVSTAGSWAFIDRPSEMMHCVDATRTHPFTRPEVTSLGVATGDALRDFLQLRYLCCIDRSRCVPRVHPGVPRHVHIDIGLTGSKLGFAMAHPFMGQDARLHVYFDMLLRVSAPSNDEVSLPAVVDFLKFLRTVGFHIKNITFDQFQSSMARQVLTMAGFTTKRLSIQLPHYNALRSAIYQHRVNMYEYLPLLGELKALRKSDKPAGRPSHPPGGYDDVADAAAGALSHCLGIADAKKVPQELPAAAGRMPVPIMIGGTSVSELLLKGLGDF